MNLIFTVSKTYESKYKGPVSIKSVLSLLINSTFPVNLQTNMQVWRTYHSPSVSLEGPSTACISSAALCNQMKYFQQLYGKRQARIGILWKVVMTAHELGRLPLEPATAASYQIQVGFRFGRVKPRVHLERPVTQCDAHGPFPLLNVWKWFIGGWIKAVTQRTTALGI